MDAAPVLKDTEVKVSFASEEDAPPAAPNQAATLRSEDHNTEGQAVPRLRLSPARERTVTEDGPEAADADEELQASLSPPRPYFTAEAGQNMWQRQRPPTYCEKPGQRPVKGVPNVHMAAAVTCLTDTNSLRQKLLALFLSVFVIIFQLTFLMSALNNLHFSACKGGVGGCFQAQYCGRTGLCADCFVAYQLTEESVTYVSDPSYVLSNYSSSAFSCPQNDAICEALCVF